MPLTPFHPLVDRWFRDRFEAPTEPQRRGWPAIASGRSTLIAAPTGSGKTLAAFLVCIDQLVREGLAEDLPDEIRAVYVSPLKALSNDIRRNLESPLAQINAAAEKDGLKLPPLRALVRTGDTPAHERAAMLKKPPHILVTTPESLYLLLTAEKSRALLGGVRTVIIDEIHALARDKRGSHLSLSIERLEGLCRRPPTRIGLSATQKPIEEIARFLVGTHRVSTHGKPDCEIIDVGHARQLDLAVQVPPSELGAVCSHEQWDEIYKDLAALISAHRSTVVFVNTRRMAERVSHRLREHLGEKWVASHHGSLARHIRLDAEERLKRGELKAIVATASLELGIDIGFIDLVCQIGSPRSIATFLQRVGRSGHHLGVVPKGRLFALTRDELMEALAILRAVRQGRLDHVEIPKAPLDILAQQIVAEVAGAERSENDLFRLVRGAWPYRDLSRAAFDRIVRLTSEGIVPGRKEGAYLHRDAVHKKLRARRSARLTALTAGGAIPETGDYRVVTEDEGAVVGTLNEDFAIESLAGDVFLLGNTSWRIRYVRAGQVVVRDAEGAPANVPFWLGEAPGRTSELSEEISTLREGIASRLDADGGTKAAEEWLAAECAADGSAARQAAAYVAAQKIAVGMVPTQKEILFERFFDESGGMQLVIHAPYGVRINRAWGLAMRKRFCRTFDFELQASADDNGITLSLGPQHSFPLDDMFKLLKSQNAEDVLIQALLAAPMFGLRWRWNATRALAVLRARGGKKTPPPLQRFKSDDLLTAVFPLQTACFENRPPDVELPKHPLIDQTVDDCLHEAMDVDGWTSLLVDIEKGRVKLVAKDTREPSPFSHAILNANPYSFLDDAPLEERRARAVAVRRTLAPEEMRDLARLDPEAIDRVVAEAAPVVRDPEELHDLLLTLGAWPTSGEPAAGDRWKPFFETLRAAGRATEAHRNGPSLWVAAERWTLVQAAFPDAQSTPMLALPASLRIPVETEAAVVALVRGRLEIDGPTTASRIAAILGLAEGAVENALLRLEAEGVALRGHYLPGETGVHWCERRLLARIHRLTLEGARRRVQPVSPARYWMFLAEYHHVLPESRREGPLGLREAIGQLQGFEMPAGAWEMDALSTRVEDYRPEWLDALSYTGELAWGRLRPPARPEDEEPSAGGLTRAVPISLGFREDLPWLLPPQRAALSEQAKARGEAEMVQAALERHGALFARDLADATGLLPSRLEDALSQLAALGRVTADGFAALRALIHAKKFGRHRPRRSPVRAPVPAYPGGGRWTVFPGRVSEASPEERVKAWARQLLRRYGVVFRDLLARETVTPAWWELVRLYRQMEARGELRGGRFIAGVAGEQYALPEAVEGLRKPRDSENAWVTISAADPLNLTGVALPEARVPATRGNRLLFHNGVLVATLQAGEVEWRIRVDDEAREKIIRLLRLTQLPRLRDELLQELAQKTPA